MNRRTLSFNKAVLKFSNRPTGHPLRRKYVRNYAS
jgi:hypothetical protein